MPKVVGCRLLLTSLKLTSALDGRVGVSEWHVASVVLKMAEIDFDAAPKFEKGWKTIGEERFFVLRTIGSGYAGLVVLASWEKTGQQVALKFIRKFNYTPGKKDRVSREIQFLRLLHHENIVCLFDVLDDESQYVLVMEHVSGGELFKHISKHGRMSENESRALFRQLLDAVNYCHSNLVVHRDLKPENVLLVDKHHRQVKIIDFGFSNSFEPDHLLSTFCGSPNYAAPEIIRGEPYSAPQVDVWSLAVILYVCVCGCLPFRGEDIHETYKNVLSGKPYYPSFLSHGTTITSLLLSRINPLPLDCVSLMKSMLRVDPLARATIAEIAASSWMTKGNRFPISLSAVDRRPVETVDERTVSELVHFGYAEEEVLSSLARAEVNPIRCAYYLMMEKANRELDERRATEQTAFLKRKRKCILL